MITAALAGASAKPIILSILNNGEAYGYQLVLQVNKLSDGALVWNHGTLYPVLHRLEDKGLVTSEWRSSDEGRQRKYYRLTKKGHRELETEKQQWLTVDAVLAQLWGLETRLT